MSTTEPRTALSEVLRVVTPGIVARIVEETGRVSGASAEDLHAYEAFMGAIVSDALDAVAAPDPERGRMFARLAAIDVEGARRVPPVARVGLLEIGIRLARVEVARECALRPDREAVEREFEVLAGQMRAALAALVAGDDAR